MMRQALLSKSVRSKPRSPWLQGSSGFTLIEMLVVLVIIGLIMGLVGPRVLSYLTDARIKATKLQIEALGSALDLYYLDNGRYPSSSEGLEALVRRPANSGSWNGPYLRGGLVPPDPWKNDYIYRSPAEDSPYEIMSYGADGREGGAGSATDIKSSKQ